MAELQTHDPLPVTRVHTRGGSHIEPPLEQHWSDLDKLRWCAGAVLADTGHVVRIVTGAFMIGHRVVRDHYGLQWSGGSGSGGRFHEVWSWLNGYQAGVAAHPVTKEDA